MTEKTIGNLALDEKENAESKTPASLADLQKLNAANDPKYNVLVENFVARHTAKQDENTDEISVEKPTPPQSTSPKAEYNPELSQKTWDTLQTNYRWDATPKGRAIERLFTRGIGGAAAFAWGGWYASRGGGMRGLNAVGETIGYAPELSWSEVTAAKRPLMFIAKVIDSTAGNVIKATAKFLGSENHEKSVRFRPTNSANPLSGGRSLGHETVAVTFDFFCASVADAALRNLHDAFDPNIKHNWRNDKGYINPIETLKETGKAAFRWVTYNGGEDWAVALPYVYYLRGQRNLINKFSPGFSYDSDRGANGGSFKVNQEGKITGNYTLAGMLDLQGRFTAYNVGTLMFREAYNHVENIIAGHPTALYGEDNKQKGHDAENLLKWGARSLVKGVITMTPVVPFFSIFRTPQSKYKGLFINPENESVMGYETIDKNGKTKYDAMIAIENSRENVNFSSDTPVNFRKLNNSTQSLETIGDAVKNHPLSNQNKPFDPYAQHKGILNSIGKVQSEFRANTNNLVKAQFGDASIKKRTMSTYWNAAFAYTPYMYAKRESAILWDNGKMDVAAERMIDGVADLNLKEVKAGAKEIWQAIKRTPFDDKEREKAAKHRIFKDTSPPDGMTKENANALRSSMYSKDHELTWEERMIKANPKDKKSDYLKSNTIKKRDTYTDEAMRRALEEFSPPTNSIH